MTIRNRTIYNDVYSIIDSLYINNNSNKKVEEWIVRNYDNELLKYLTNIFETQRTNNFKEKYGSILNLLYRMKPINYYHLKKKLNSEDYNKYRVIIQAIDDIKKNNKTTPRASPLPSPSSFLLLLHLFSILYLLLVQNLLLQNLLHLLLQMKFLRMKKSKI